MKKRKKKNLFKTWLIVAVILLSGTTFGQGLAISAKLGTYGAGAEIVGGINEKLSVRGGFSYFAFDYTDTYEELAVESTVNFKLGNLSLIADYYFLPKMHISAGVLYNLSKETITGTPSKNIVIGNQTYTPEQLGELSIDIEPQQINPYVGLGFGRTIGIDELVSFNFELGAVYHGEPQASLSADGMIHPTENEVNELQINNNLSNFTLFPVITLQLSFKIL